MYLLVSVGAVDTKHRGGLKLSFKEHYVSAGYYQVRPSFIIENISGDGVATCGKGAGQLVEKMNEIEARRDGNFLVRGKIRYILKIRDIKKLVSLTVFFFCSI